MANGFVNPYQTQLSGLQQKQALAQALMQRGMSAPGMQTPLSSLANIATAIMGAKQYGALGTQQEELAKKQADQQRLEMARALSAYRGDQPYQAETFGPEDVLPQGLKTMGTGQNRSALVQALAESTNPAYQQAALTQMLQPTLMEKAQAKAAAEGGGPFGGTNIQAQAFNNIVAYETKKRAGQQTTPQEDVAYRLAIQQVSMPKYTTTASGETIQYPGINVAGLTSPVGMPQQPQVTPGQTMPQTLQQPMPSGTGAQVISRKSTPGIEQMDKQFGKEWAQFNASGGFADTQKQINQIGGAIDELKTGKATTGGVSGYALSMLPEFAGKAIAPELAAVKQRVEDVVQRNLRAILGAQFTENEGNRLIARAFDPQLKPEENIYRLEMLQRQMMDAARAKQEAGAYFDQYGTLQGFRGKVYSATDFSPEVLFGDVKPQSTDQTNSGGVKFLGFE